MLEFLLDIISQEEMINTFCKDIFDSEDNILEVLKCFNFLNEKIELKDANLENQLYFTFIYSYNKDFDIDVNSNIDVSLSKADIENLEYIKQKCELYLFNERQRNIIENALDIMFYSKELKIGQAVLPRENVRSRMQILNASIIFYAFDKLNNLKPDMHINNSTNFMISCLYNAITEYYSDSDLQYRIDYGSG